MKFKCYLCGNSSSKVRASAEQMRFGCYGHDKKIVECGCCGLVQLFPLWSEKEMASLYEKYSQKKDFKGYKKPPSINRYLKKHIKKDDVILEIGCGTGDNIRWLKDEGYNAIGLDRDPTVRDGNIILNYEFEDLDVQNKFDFIYAIHVLEHIVDPIPFLNKIVDYLDDEGICLLEVPCVEDPLLTLYENEAYKEFAWYPYHIYCYSAKTIKTLTDKIEGLDVEIVRKQRYGVINHLRWLIKGKPGNINSHIPIVDDIYKFILTKMFKVSDTLIIHGKKTA